jgi:RNA polymerase sigma-70 factor (ECF subfamily)
MRPSAEEVIAQDSNPIDGSLQASRGGDSEAFGQLVETHQREVYGLAFRLTGRGDVADDVTQETFLAAWRNLAKFRGESAFRTWLLRIALNKVRSHWRRQKLRNFISLDDSPNENGNALGDIVADPSRGASPVSAFEDKHFQENLQAILMDFSPRQREVIVLRAQGLEIHEIGSMLGLASGTVKAHLFEAKRKLEERLRVKSGA